MAAVKKVNAFDATLSRVQRLEAALEQIRTVCDDNAPASCDKEMALNFVRDVAAKALA